MVKTLRPTVDLVFIFLAEKEEKIINRKVVSCTSFIPARFSRGQLFIQETKAINVKTVKLKYLGINLKLGLSGYLLSIIYPLI